MGKKRETKSAAIITIFDAAEMTPRGKCDIARWLHRQARFVTMHGYEMSKRFTARYIYDPTTDLRNDRNKRRRTARENLR